MPTETRSRWIQLDCSDEGSRVVVTPENQDRFVLSVRDAAEACRAARAVDSFVAQFNALLQRLARWLRDHPDACRKAFVTVRDAGLLFVIVGPAARHEAEVEEALTDLDLEVARDPSLDKMDLNVMALPLSGEAAYESFLHPEHPWVFKDGN